MEWTPSGYQASHRGRVPPSYGGWVNASRSACARPPPHADDVSLWTETLHAHPTLTPAQAVLIRGMLLAVSHGCWTVERGEAPREGAPQGRLG